MTKNCSICGRGSLKANQVCYSKKKSIKRQKINLQTLFKDGKRVVACTSCIKNEMKKAVKAK
ncbi:MAG: 50S ribosomal protein L28 [Patescibacteria group bacterium]